MMVISGFFGGLASQIPSYWEATIQFHGRCLASHGLFGPELVRWCSDRVGKWPIAGVWYMRFIKLPGTSSYGTCKFLSIYGLRCHPSGASAVKQETHRNPWASSVPLGPVTGREWRSVFRFLGLVLLGVGFYYDRQEHRRDMLRWCSNILFWIIMSGMLYSRSFAIRVFRWNKQHFAIPIFGIITVATY